MTTPQLNVPLPRPVTSLHQIELTSFCNLRCKYCPSPNLKRPKLHMTEETFEAALGWVRFFRDRGTQGELNLAGIGESTMHPQFAEWLPRAREAVGDKQRLIIATNGVTFTENIAKAAAAVNLRVVVSMHREEVAAQAIKLAKRYGVLDGVSADPALNPNDWAGQVDWHVDRFMNDAIACPWIRGGWAFVLADGRISRCCLDADGSGVLMTPVIRFEKGNPEAQVIGVPLTVEETPHSFATEPWKLCANCYQEIGIVGYDQRGGKFLPVIR